MQVSIDRGQVAARVCFCLLYDDPRQAARSSQRQCPVAIAHVLLLVGQRGLSVIAPCEYFLSPLKGTPLCCRRHARFVTKTERNQAHKAIYDYFVPLTSAVAPINFVHESQYQRDVYEVALSDAQPHGFTAQNSNEFKSCFQPAVTSVDAVWVRLNPEPGFRGRALSPRPTWRIMADQAFLLDSYAARYIQAHTRAWLQRRKDQRQVSDMRHFGE